MCSVVLGSWRTWMLYKTLSGIAARSSMSASKTALLSTILMVAHLVRLLRNELAHHSTLRGFSPRVLRIAHTDYLGCSFKNFCCQYCCYAHGTRIPQAGISLGGGQSPHNPCRPPPVVPEGPEVPRSLLFAHALRIRQQRRRDRATAPLQVWGV